MTETERRPHTPLPASLADVSRSSSDPESFVRAMKEFTDVLLSHALAAGYDGTGLLPLPSGVYDERPGAFHDETTTVYVHAFAEHLAQMAGETPPDWSQDTAAFLSEPVFAYGSNARSYVIAETPAAFRRRLLFCGAVLEKLHAVTTRRMADATPT